MADQHPITPPPELVMKWVSLACEYEGNETWIDLATQAARWGADQELEACREWLCEHSYVNGALSLLKDRRPKPPSLKKQALAALKHILNHSSTELGANTIRLALEQLND